MVGMQPAPRIAYESPREAVVIRCREIEHAPKLKESPASPKDSERIVDGLNNFDQRNGRDTSVGKIRVKNISAAKIESYPGSQSNLCG